MTFSLSAAAIGAGYRLAAFDAIGSTSEEALRRASGGEPGPLWVVSSEQTAGRGRRGSAWQTIRGNLAASLLLTTAHEPSVIAQLGFVAGLALGRAIEAVAGQGAAFRLKWPNDVLVDGGKLAGILLQTEQLPGGNRCVVIGIGVNIVSSPAGLAYPTRSLRDLGCSADAEDLFAALSETWLAVDRLWAKGRGFDSIREEWLDRAAGLGGPVSVRVSERSWTGRFETIDALGQLVMRCDDGSDRRISAGEVHFGSARSDREVRSQDRGELA